MSGLAPDRPAEPASRPRRFMRGLAVAAAWLLAVGIGTAGYATGSRWFGEAVLFGTQFGVASAMAVVVAFAISGRRRWAVGVALAIVGAVALIAATVGLLLWAVPWVTWRHLGMGSRDHRRLRGMVGWMAEDFVRSRWQIGSGLGLAVGVMAGLLLRLARRRPWLALGVALGLLLAVGSLGEAAAWRITDLVVQSRLQGGMWKVAWIRQDEITGALGAASGAIVGAIAAGVACRASRGRAAPEAPS